MGIGSAEAKLLTNIKRKQQFNHLYYKTRYEIF